MQYYCEKLVYNTSMLVEQFAPMYMFLGNDQGVRLLCSDHEKSCKHIIVYVLDISEWLYQTLFKVSAHFYFQAFYCELSPGRAMVCSHLNKKQKNNYTYCSPY